MVYTETWFSLNWDDLEYVRVLRYHEMANLQREFPVMMPKILFQITGAGAPYPVFAWRLSDGIATKTEQDSETMFAGLDLGKES